MSTHRILVPEGAVCSSNASSASAATLSNAHGNLFLDAMLEMPTTNERGSRKPLKMVASVVIHTAVLALLIIIPVFFANNSLLLQNLTPTYVFTPPPPMAPPPPAAAAPQRAVQVTPKIAIPTPAVVAPRVIPKQTSTVADNVAAPDVDPGAGVVGGVPGGVPGGVLGGILGGTGGVAGPPVPTTPQGIVRVGGNVKAPQLVDKVQPEYPPVARAAHVEGTVVIDAVIDKNGNVVSEHAVSGSNLLIAAALAAVQQWKYQPTYLNGQPVSLAMEVTVAFNLNT
jgi:periplasmic protein TonB